MEPVADLPHNDAPPSYFNILNPVVPTLRISPTSTDHTGGFLSIKFYAYYSGYWFDYPSHIVSTVIDIEVVYICE